MTAMGRMFRIITESGSEPVSYTPETPVSGKTMNPYTTDSIPFVEVGGPEGIVTSYTRTVHTIPNAAPRMAAMPTQAPRHVPQVEPLRFVQEPRYVPEPRFVPEPRVAPVQMIQPIPQPEPRTTLDPRVLSVALHKFPKPGLRILPAGIAPEVVTYHYPEHPISAEYRLVRDEIRRTFDGTHQRIVSLTSTSQATGTTTVLLNVAVAMTQDIGARVLVVDGNVLRPAVAARLAVGDAPGVSEVIAQTVPLAWAVQTTAIPGLHVLATGVANDKTIALLPNELPRMLAQVRQWFDWVFVDLGTWDHAHAPTASHLASTCDGVYLVTRHNDIERLEFNHLRASMGQTLKGYITTRQ
jgi:Mrp family chromosome partitioning ATPase